MGVCVQFLIHFDLSIILLLQVHFGVWQGLNHTQPLTSRSVDGLFISLAIQDFLDRLTSRDGERKEVTKLFEKKIQQSPSRRLNHEYSMHQRSVDCSTLTRSELHSQFDWYSDFFFLSHSREIQGEEKLTRIRHSLGEAVSSDWNINWFLWVRFRWSHKAANFLECGCFVLVNNNNFTMLQSTACWSVDSLVRAWESQSHARLVWDWVQWMGKPATSYR